MNSTTLDTVSISKILDTSYKKIKDILMNEYSHLYFYISPTGKLSCWVRTPEGNDGAGIKLERSIDVGLITAADIRYLEELDYKVAPVHHHPDKYFYCTECGEVLPKSEFEEAVFAGYYCKKCAKKPEIAAIIKESHTRGFYD